MNMRGRRGRGMKAEISPATKIGVVIEKDKSWTTETPELPEGQFLTTEVADAIDELEGIEIVEVEPEPDVATVYRWEIPGADGYALRIEFEAQNADEAREFAKVVSVGDEGNSRSLTSLERNWITTTEPQVVRATEAITLDLDSALLVNDRLWRENETYRQAVALFEQHGIDINDPMAWAESQQTAAQHKIDRADRVRAGKMRELVQALQNVDRALHDAIELDEEFAPPKPAVPQEPDYSKLVIVTDGSVEDMPHLYPRLANAKFTKVSPADPLTDEERHGYSIIFENGDGLIEDYRIRRAGPGEQEPLRAISRRIQALVGLTAEKAVEAAPPVKTGPTGIPGSLVIPKDNGDMDFVSTISDGVQPSGWKVQS